MKRIGIVINPWKLDIFAKHLREAGLAFSSTPTFGGKVLMLKVKAQFASDVAKVVNKAQAECDQCSKKQ